MAESHVLTAGHLKDWSNTLSSKASRILVFLLTYVSRNPLSIDEYCSLVAGCILELFKK